MDYFSFLKLLLNSGTFFKEAKCFDGTRKILIKDGVWVEEM
jgi:hypothetical protein